MRAVSLRLAVASGGVLGAAVRLVAVRAAADGGGRAWLWLVVGVINVAGCLVVGGAVAAADRWSWPSQWRLAVTVGFCGGLTTFATLAVEVALAANDGPGTAAAAVGWAAVSLGLGVTAVAVGRSIVMRGAAT